MKKNVVKLNENTLRQIVAESVKKVLKEWDDEDNYYGGGLPDSYFNDEAHEEPEDYSVSKVQREQLESMINTLIDIGNDVDGGLILYKAADIIKDFLSDNN